MVIIKDKLISFPTEILDALDDYRKSTGVPATDYIRTAVIRSMILDKLIVIKTKVVFMDKKENKTT